MQKEVKLVKCPTCGKKVPDDWYCKECGQKMKIFKRIHINIAVHTTELEKPFEWKRLKPRLNKILDNEIHSLFVKEVEPVENIKDKAKNNSL